MSTKSRVVKSKSSNGAIVSKMEKIFSSNSEFKPHLVKKKGVYVDRRGSLSPVCPRERNIKRKSPPRPKPGQKKFLASVLTILSKSTTGTQYPDEQTETADKPQNKHDIHTSKKCKRKTYKSKILNTRNALIEDEEQFVVLQSKKNIVNTPSIYSNTSTFQVFEDKPKARSVRDVLNSNYFDYDEIDSKKKVTINDDPETLVKNTENDKDDGKLYNMFVDLLQSTFNDYNFKEDEVLSEKSNPVFEIEECIAKKLTIGKPKHIISEPVKNQSPFVNEYKSYRHINKPIDIKLSNPEIIKHSGPKIKAKSFIQTKKSVNKQTNSFQEKKTKKNRKKENLLNLLKEQLQIQPMFEEPLNLYQTLKVMAKNKKAYQRSFTKEQKNYSFDNKECVYKRKDLIKLNSDKRLGKNYSLPKKNSELNRPKKKKVESNHSLEIFELNLEEPYKNEEKILDDISQLDSETNLDYYTLLKFPDNSVYNF